MLTIRTHDDVIKWKHSARYWPFVRGIHRSRVNSLHKGQWRGALMFPLNCVWINGWVNNRETGDLRRYRPSLRQCHAISHTRHQRKLVRSSKQLRLLCPYVVLQLLFLRSQCSDTPSSGQIVAILSTDMEKFRLVSKHAVDYFTAFRWFYIHVPSKVDPFPGKSGCKVSCFILRYYTAWDLEHFLWKYITLTCGDPVISVMLGQYHGCWGPGDVRS